MHSIRRIVLHSTFIGALVVGIGYLSSRDSAAGRSREEATVWQAYEGGADRPHSGPDLGRWRVQSGPLPEDPPSRLPVQ